MHLAPRVPTSAVPGWARDASTPVLPAEAPAFWLRLALIGLAMIIAFMAWFLYVTRKVGAPASPREIAAAPASPAEAVARIVPPAPLPAHRPAPTPAPVPAPAATSIPDRPVKAAEPPLAERRPPPADARSTSRVPRQARAEQIGEPSAAATQRALALARAMEDSGPPIAAGPGPQYSWAQTPPRSYPDPGPPIAVGPGPLYDSSRVAVRTPSWSSNDGGPPVTIGPGPLVDYSVRGVRAR